MKAFVVEHYGKDGLRAAEVPEPEVGDADVLVKVSAAGINPLDTMVRNGEFKRLLKYQTPFVLGHDVAGVVTRVGSAVRDFQVGDQVYARPRDLRIGTFAQRLAAGFATRPYRSSDSTVYVCLEGGGRATIDGATGPTSRFEFAPRDVFVVPSWHAFTLAAGADTVLFSFSDRPVQQVLGLWREERL